MSISDGSVEYSLKTASSTDDLTSSINNLNISTFAHTFLDDTSANEVRNTLNAANKDDIFPKYDNAAAHNSIYRGKDLTLYFNSGAMSTAIANGTFADIYPGDYIIKSVTIDGTTYQNVKWIVMDCDYHLNSGDTQTTTHHVVLMPEGHLGTAQMNETNTTEGGYQGSKMWTTTIPLVNAGIKTAFGDSHVLSHKELLTKTIDATAISGGNSTWQGCSVDWSWVSVEANICNEQQVYGTKAFGSSGFDIGDCYNQFAAFRLSKALQSKDRYWFWLRAVASASMFCLANDLGFCYYYDPSSSSALRPYFLLK